MSNKKYLFVDRDGTIIEEPPDEQIDSLEKLKFLPGVIGNLFKIINMLDYRLVMVSNQDGLGTDQYPEEDFNLVQAQLLETLKREGVEFEEICIDRSTADCPSPNRKPATGMVKHYLMSDFDRENSFVVGDRSSDVELAKNMGLKAIKFENGETLPEDLMDSCSLQANSWNPVYEFLKTRQRFTRFERETRETKVKGSISLDGTGKADISTGLGFLDHMLDQLVFHGGMNLALKTEGDLWVDEHHTIEDTAIALGEAFASVLANKKGLARYGFYVPMDESLARCILDFGGRSYLQWKVEFSSEKVGDVPTGMFEHFFRSFAEKAKCNLHVTADGKNDHHKIEAVFKAFARALKQAVKLEDGNSMIPSSKGNI
jgi:imidazoleglycerol-phosphate dehydratase/histidinol-phosphatase